MSDDTNSSVDDLLNQLQSSGAIKDVKEDSEEFTLTKDKLEEFLLQHSGKLIKGSLEYIDDIGQYVTAAPDSKDVEALAKLVASSAAAIETLNKIHIADQKNKSSMDIKKLDIASKKELQLKQDETKLLLNREELMAKLIKDAKIIDVIEED